MDPDLFAAQSFLSSSFVDAALTARQSSAQSGAQTALSGALAGADPKAAAEQFEAFFLSQVIETMQSGESLQSAFGGGPGEGAWKSFLNEEYAQAIVRSGGVGLADRLMAEIIALQADMNALDQ